MLTAQLLQLTPQATTHPHLAPSLALPVLLPHKQYVEPNAHESTTLPCLLP